MLFYIADPYLRQDPAFFRRSLSKWSLQELFTSFFECLAWLPWGHTWVNFRWVRAAVMERFAVSSTNREISGKRIRATSAYEQQGAREEGGWRTNSTTCMANGKGTRHCSTVLGSATTGHRTALKLGLQQFNLQLINVNCTGTCIKMWINVDPQCKSKNRNNSALLILTDQLITTSRNKWIEGWIKSSAEN